MIKIISVQQPWAWLLVTPELTDTERKDVENRTWWTNYRGTLLIHASKTFDSDGYDWLRKHLPKVADQVKKHFNIRKIWDSPGCTSHLVMDRSEFCGIVGKVNLNRIETDSKSRWAAPGQYHWMVSDGRELPFTPYRGQLRLWSDPTLFKRLGLVA